MAVRPFRIEFTYKGEPLTKSNSAMWWRGKMRIPTRIRRYEQGLIECAKKVMKQTKRRPTKKLVEMKITYYVKSKRIKDLQNLPKSTCDCLNNIIYKDDFQIRKLTIERFLDRKNPRIHVIVEETTDSAWQKG